jgi:hypothetical protein
MLAIIATTKLITPIRRLTRADAIRSNVRKGNDPSIRVGAFFLNIFEQEEQKGPGWASFGIRSNG